MGSEEPASVRSVSALHSTVLELTCDLTNTRVSLEQSIFALQDQVQSLQTLTAQLQEQLVRETQEAREARFQAALARLEIQQLLERLEAAEDSD